MNFQPLEIGRFQTSKLRNFRSLERFTAIALLFVATVAQAASPFRDVLSFSITTNVGFGNEVFVTGNHADIGNWDPARGAKLVWNPGNVWTGRVALQAGTTVDFKYVSLQLAATEFCNPAYANWMPPGDGNHSVTSAPAAPAAPFAGKTMYYHSSWTSATLVFSVDGTNFTGLAMTAVGAGRFSGETLFRVSGFGDAGAPVQFVVNGYLNGTQYWDNAPYPGYGSGDYYTGLDAFFVQDGDVYDYWPAASVSVSRVVVTNIVSSSHPAVPSRNVRIYLPRGYDNHPGRRYPVLYMHDGENVFTPGGTFGSWDADLTATREISQGRMREAIIVGVLGNNTSQTSRIIEYLPPGDAYDGKSGRADMYGRFLIDNVRPTMDANFRTWNDRRNTLVMGSSMGGLVSAYLAFSTNVFGATGIVSPAYWTAPNYQGWIESNATHGVRLYTDFGTAESDSAWIDFWNVRDSLVRDGYTENLDLLTRIACGAVHNEAAWAARLPGAFRFLLNLADEPNELLAAEHPPGVTSIAATGATFRITTPTLAHRAYTIDAAATPNGPWAPASTAVTERLPWSTRTLDTTNAPAPTTILRVRSTPAN